MDLKHSIYMGNGYSVSDMVNVVSGIINITWSVSKSRYRVKNEE